MWHDSFVTSLTETEARQPSAQFCVLSVICKEKSVWSIFKSLEQTPSPPSQIKINRRSEWDDLILPYNTTWIHVELPCSYPQKQSQRARKDAPISFWKLKHVFETNPPPSPLGKGLQQLQRPPDEWTPRDWPTGSLKWLKIPSSQPPHPVVKLHFRHSEWHFQTSNKKGMQNTSGPHSHQLCQRKYLT